jgi:DNA modification methylase
VSKDISLFIGDARELALEHIEPESVDLIYTDPPYPKEFHYLYEWLAQEAVRVLKPDGFMIAYAGPYWKDVVMQYFDAQLQYFYDFIMLHKGRTSILYPRKILSRYKSMLCYHKNGERPLPNRQVLGLWEGTGEDKRYHHWGQEEQVVRYHLECFSDEDDLVVDYFLGGGTTGAICKEMGRKFVGFEIDEESFDISSRRIIESKPPKGALEQITIFGGDRIIFK